MMDVITYTKTSFRNALLVIRSNYGTVRMVSILLFRESSYLSINCLDISDDSIAKGNLEPQNWVY
jgi:hypothetical protein